MTAALIPTLYVMSGVCAFAALHQGLAYARRRGSHIHLLFALLSVSVMVMILAKAGAYQAETAQALVVLRKWEVSAITFLFVFLSWFVANFTGVRHRKLLIGLSVFWALLFAVNLALPYGIYHNALPTLTPLELPWGETVNDLHVPVYPTWLNIGWLGIIVVMGYSVHATIAQYRRGQRERARVLAWALGVFFASILFNLLVNWEIIDFIHLSDFGFISMLIMMDLEMMLSSRDQTRRMRDVLDRLPAAICLKDLHGRFQLFNLGFARLANVDLHHIIGKTDFDVFTREQAERFHADAVRAAETHQEVQNETVLERNGSRHLIETHHFPLLRPDGSSYAVCGVYVDVTEARQKDEALHKFRRQIWHTDRVASTGAISASLAHEICQPLAAILNNAQAGLRFLGHEQVDLEEIRAIFQDIVRDDKRAGTIINGLRAMLQQQELPYATMDLAQAIEEVIELLHSELIRQGVEVEQALETGLTVRANKTQLQQVVLNLMINGMEAMADQAPGERILRIEAAPTDGKACASVRDAGIGIPEDMLDKIFEGFYTTKAQGLGVGLEVCRSILESHHGSIWAEANPDRGATFHFTLPLIKAAAPENKANA